ncbi:diaminopimelate epimerase [Lachnospiraceae bacterium XBB2008]|nr:diaminopimelate epimerase [Lachnospiraceae bacterium XBB2008]
MRFTKMHGCGNDYVYVDGSREHIDPALKPEAVRALSDRHTGIGGDGVIFINPSDVADFEMEMWNADGTRSEMCGNGIRCVAKYVYDHALTGKTELDIVSAGSIKHILLFPGEDGKIERVRVDMGAPGITPDPVTISGLEFSCVSMGNPHAITLVDDVHTADVHGIGPVIENDPFFPNRTNVEFVHIVDRAHIDMRVWERGTGETQACGTGACASAVACIARGLCDTKVDVKLLGGTLTIEWDGDTSSHIFMTGPATEVFSGEIDI